MKRRKVFKGEPTGGINNRVCTNKNCPNYSATLDKQGVLTWCSLKCKYDDPEIATKIPYYGY